MKISNKRNRQEMTSFFLLALFQILFTGMALIQSGGMVFYHVKTKVEKGAQAYTYFHTETMKIVAVLILTMGFLLFLEALVSVYSWQNDLKLSLILHPVGLWISIGMVLTLFCIPVMPEVRGAILPTQYLKNYINLLLAIGIMWGGYMFGSLPCSMNTYWKLVAVYIALLFINVISGAVTNGSRAWIAIGPLHIQIGELLKCYILILGILGFPYRERKYVMLSLFVTGFAGVGMLLSIHDLGNAIILAFLVLAVMYMYNRTWTLCLLIGGAVIGIGAFALRYGWLTLVSQTLKHEGNPEQAFLEDHIYQRVVQTWKLLTDERYSGNESRNMLLGMARGGILGTGLKGGEYLYMTKWVQAGTDYAFCVLCGIFGLPMGVLLVASLLVFCRNTRRAVSEAASQRELFASSLCVVLFLVQAVVHIGGNLNMIPFTGVTLNFISYGGSSLMASGLTLGILMSSQQPLWLRRRVARIVKRVKDRVAQIGRVLKGPSDKLRRREKYRRVAVEED